MKEASLRRRLVEVRQCFDALRTESGMVDNALPPVWNRFAKSLESLNVAATESLQNSEARIQLLVKSSSIGLWDWNLLTNEVFFSPEWKQHLGYTRDELTNHYEEWERRLHPEDREPTLRAVKDFQEGRSAEYDVEFRLRHKDGSWRSILARADMIRDAMGRPIRMMGCHIDITERARHQHEERIARIAETAPGALCSFRMGLDGTFSFPYVSPMWEEFYQLKQADVQMDAEPAQRRVHPDDATRIGETIQASARSMQPWRQEFRIVNPVRGLLWVEGHSRPVREPDGGILWLGFVTDITERKQAEEERRQLFERITDACVALDRDWIYTFVSEKAGQILGRRAEDLMGKHVWTEFASPPESNVRAACEQAMRDQRSAHLETYSEYFARWLELRLYPAPEGLTIYFHDITERKSAEEALRASEVQLRVFVEQAPSAIAMFDRNMICLAASRPWLTDFGRGRENLVGLSHYEVHPDIPDRWKKIHRASLEGSDQTSDEDLWVQGDGRPMWLRWAIKPWRDTHGDIGGIMMMAEDITDRKQAQLALQQANARLQNLSRRLLEIQETERRYLARELHDEIGQALTAAKINLQSMQRLPDVAAVRLRLDDSVDIVERALQQVRSLSLELRPPLLDDLGLCPALRWLSDQHARRSGLNVEFKGGLMGTRFDAAVETACFRIAQEALNNIVRHAGAKNVMLSVDVYTSGLHVRVSDDGSGFDVAAARLRAAQGGSLGLLGMEERAALAGGAIEWRSVPARGTEVHAWFPLPYPADSDKKGLPVT